MGERGVHGLHLILPAEGDGPEVQLHHQERQAVVVGELPVGEGVEDV